MSYIIMMTSSNGTIFRVTGPLCGEFTGPGDFPAQRPVTRSFGVFFDLRPNKQLSKQPRGWWFETPSLSLWRHCNDTYPEEIGLPRAMAEMNTKAMGYRIPTTVKCKYWYTHLIIKWYWDINFLVSVLGIIELVILMHLWVNEISHLCFTKSHLLRIH